VSISLNEFLVLRRSLPVADVRSPLEFETGHIPGVVNVPILNNEERVAVGTDYKTKGQAEAIKTGFRLVGPRLIDIIEQAQHIGNEMIVHCWRGGMRSRNFCQFVGMAGVKTHALEGGYKAYRTYAYEIFRRPLPLVLLGGCTGSGKSEILQGLKASGEQVIDLETLASHKGSVFGGLMMPPQPTTEQFENFLFEEMLKLDPSRLIWVEDESIAVGKVFLPQPFWQQLGRSPVVEIVLDKAARIERLVEEYGRADQESFLTAMDKITKKLGGQHYKAAREHWLAGDAHTTIDILLTYYDKAYRTGLERKQNRLLGSFSWDGRDASTVVQALTRMDLKSLPSLNLT
jgi:tRNA 2-selenouridine synthase